MHDTLEYFARRAGPSQVPSRRADVPHLYAFNENFVLPLSHDEVVYGKGSLHRQDAGRRLAAVRQPAPALRLHVGASGQEARCSWAASSASGANGTHERRASTGTCCDEPHARRRAALGRGPEPRLRAPSPRCTSSISTRDGFEWIDCRDAENSVLAFLRRPRDGDAPVLVVCNFTPVPRARTIASACRSAGRWREMLNSDATHYGGSGDGQPRRRARRAGARARPLPFAVR